MLFAPQILSGRFLRPPAASGYAFLIAQSAGSTDGGTTTTTTAAIDTTGAKLIAVSCTGFGQIPTLSDSASNTWVTTLTEADSGSVRQHTRYVINPTTSASHTFTLAAVAASGPSLAVAVFSDGSGTPVFDAAATVGTGTSSTASASSLTPAVDNSIVIAGVGALDSISSISNTNGDFIIPTNGKVSFSGGAHLGVAIAYLIQTTAAAADPDWTLASSVAWGATLPAYKPS